MRTSGCLRFATSALTSVRNHTDRIHSLRVRGGNETPNALGPTTDQHTRYQQARDSDRASERRVLLTFLTYSLTQTQYFTGGQVEHTVVTLPAQAFRDRGVGRGGLGWGPMGRIVGQCYGIRSSRRIRASGAARAQPTREMDASPRWPFLRARGTIDNRLDHARRRCTTGRLHRHLHHSLSAPRHETSTRPYAHPTTPTTVGHPAPCSLSRPALWYMTHSCT